MSRKRSLDEKEGEPAKKKSKLTSPAVDRASKPELSKAWTRTDPLTGETGRLQRKDAAYRKHLARRKTHQTKKKGAKEKPKEKNKEEQAQEDKEDYADLTARFDGHVVIVAGGGEGIGQAVAIRLVKEGAIVYILDKKKWKDTEKLCAQSVLKKDQEVGEGMKCDVTDVKELKKCVEYVADKHGYIDVLVNAAMLHEGDAISTEKIKNADLEKIMGTNFTGAMNACQSVLPYMREECYGRIINIVSFAGLRAKEGQLMSASASGALIAATRVMGKEYSKIGVTINCVAHAYVETETESEKAEVLKLAQTETPIGRAAELAEIAGVVAFAACEENTYTTGFVYDCTGGMY